MTKFHGWSNRSTWAVSVWINNDESLYNECVGQSDLFIKDFLVNLLGDGTGDNSLLNSMKEDIGDLDAVDWHAISDSLAS